MNRRRRINLAIPICVLWHTVLRRNISVTKPFKNIVGKAYIKHNEKFSRYIFGIRITLISFLLATFVLLSASKLLSFVFVKIARKIPDPIPKFHGFVDLTPVGITRASLNYRGVSLYFGRRREIFLTHQLYGREGENTSQMAREDGWDAGVRWKFRASRISFSTLCVCLSSSTFAMKRPAVLS